MKTMKIKVTFQDPILGMTPVSPDVWTRWQEYKSAKVTAKAAEVFGKNDEAEDVNRLSEEIERDQKGVLGFPRNDGGQPVGYDYQWRGYFKDAFKALLASYDGQTGSIWSKTKAKENGLSNWTAARVVDQSIFVMERKIPFEGFDVNNITFCERPLRAMTMKGERQSIACSEQIPAGATCTFTIKLLKNDLEDYIKEALDYGSLRGWGGWRNSGKGRFTWEIQEA